MFLVTPTLLQKILLICVGQCLANLMDNHLKLLLYNLLIYFRWLDIWNGLLNLRDEVFYFFQNFLYGKVKFKINLKKSSVKHSFSQYPVKEFIMGEINTCSIPNTLSVSSSAVFWAFVGSGSSSDLFQTLAPAPAPTFFKFLAKARASSRSHTQHYSVPK